jgi:hypothetical protein
MLLYAVFALEALDPSGGIDQTLLAGVKGVTLCAHLDVHLAQRRARLEGVSTRAGHYTAVVLRMYSRLHLDNTATANRSNRRYHRRIIHTIDWLNEAKLRIFAAVMALAIVAAAASARAGGDNADVVAGPARKSAVEAPGYAPEDQTLFAPWLEVVAPGPERARRALGVLDRQFTFQQKIAFHPQYSPALLALLEELPPRQATLIRAPALYSRDNIPWAALPDGSHQVSVAGHPRETDYYYTVTRSYRSPESAETFAGAFALKPTKPSTNGAMTSVVGQLGGEVLLDTYGATAWVDVSAQALRRVYGDLKPPWDTVPGKFNHHDEAALARFKRDMPALYERIAHYLTVTNVVDEFDGADGPYVLFNLEGEIKPEALKPFANLHRFYQRVIPAVRADSAITDENGRYWLRTRFEGGRFQTTFMNRAGLLVPFDEKYRPAGDGVALNRITSGRHYTTARVVTRRLGMTFGLDHLGFTAEYRRDGDTLAYRSRMNRVPDLIAPPVILEMINFVAGEFMRILAEGNGGLAATLSSRRLDGHLVHLRGGVTGEFSYSPTLEFLARIGDAIADEHDWNVRADERKLGEEFFKAFLKDFRAARGRILALDDKQAITN